MYFEKINAFSFGRLVREELKLAPGLNVIFGPNETGKSTWHAAIYAGLCGMRRGKGRISVEDQEFRERHRPWRGDPGFKVGVQIALQDAKERRVELVQDLERRVAEVRDAVLPDRDYSSEIDYDGAPDGAKWLGLTRENFLRTACIRQTQVLRVAKEAEGLQQALQEAATAGSRFTPNTAIGAIEKFRNEEIGSDRAPTRPRRLASDRIAEVRHSIDDARKQRREYESFSRCLQEQQQDLLKARIVLAELRATNADDRLEEAERMGEGFPDGPPTKTAAANELQIRVGEAMTRFRDRPNPELQSGQELRQIQRDLIEIGRDREEQKALLADDQQTVDRRRQQVGEGQQTQQKAEVEHARSVGDLERIDTRIGERKSALTATVAELDTERRSLQELEERARRLDQELAKHRAERERADAEQQARFVEDQQALDRQRQRVEEAQQAQQEAEVEHARSVGDLEGIDTRVGERKSALRAVEAKLDSDRQVLQQVEEQATEIKQELANRRDLHEQADAEKTRLHHKQSETSAEAARLLAQLEQAGKQLERNQRRLDEITAQLPGVAPLREEGSSPQRPRPAVGGLALLALLAGVGLATSGSLAIGTPLAGVGAIALFVWAFFAWKAAEHTAPGGPAEGQAVLLAERRTLETAQIEIAGRKAQLESQLQQCEDTLNELNQQIRVQADEFPELQEKRREAEQRQRQVELEQARRQARVETLEATIDGYRKEIEDGSTQRHEILKTQEQRQAALHVRERELKVHRQELDEAKQTLANRRDAKDLADRDRALKESMREHEGQQRGVELEQARRQARVEALETTIDGYQKEIEDLSIQRPVIFKTQEQRQAALRASERELKVRCQRLQEAEQGLDNRKEGAAEQRAREEQLLQRRKAAEQQRVEEAETADAAERQLREVAGEALGSESACGIQAATDLMRTLDNWLKDQTQARHSDQERADAYAAYREFVGPRGINHLRDTARQLRDEADDLSCAVIGPIERSNGGTGASETELQERVRTLEGDVRELEGQHQELRRTLPSLAELEEELETEKRRLLNLEGFDATLAKAVEHLKDAEEHVYRELAPKLQVSIQQHLPRVTRGRYEACKVDPDTLKLEVESPEAGWVSAGGLSLGTQEQVYLLLRFALAEHLTKPGQKCPLILDDVLAAADAGRKRGILDTLLALGEETQVVLFTHEDDVHQWARTELTAGRHKLIELSRETRRL